MIRALNNRALSFLGREALAGLAPGGVALLLLALSAPGTAKTSIPADEGEQPIPEAKHERTLDRGSSKRLDLAALDRRYSDLARTLKRSFSKVRVKPPQALRTKHDAKLPACRRRHTREVRTAKTLPRQFRGRTFYFAAIPRSGWLRLPPAVAKDKKTQILITRVDRMKDLTNLSRRLKRRLTLVSGEFARALGVRCVNTRVTVSETGKAVTLHESR